MSSRLIWVEDATRAGFVQLLRAQLKLFLSLLEITFSNCGTNLFDLRANGSLDRSIAQSKNIVLTKTFFGAGGIRHL